MTSKDWWVDGHFIAAATLADAVAEVKRLYDHDAEHARPWTPQDQADLDADEPQVKVIMERHYTHRRHSTWTATIPATWLEDGRYFTEYQEATPDFDQWMCDNGTETDVDYTEDGDPDVEDLHYEVVTITDTTTLEGTPHD